MFSPTWETQISSDMCSPTLETHIHSDICSATWETQIPSDMCSLSWETHISSDMCSSFFLSASPLVTSAFGQRFVGVQPRPKHPAARDKNPLVTRVWFNTILSTLYFVFYSGHGDVSKSNSHLCSHGCSMGLYL